MIAEKKVEKQENSSVKLTVTVNGEETSKAYKDLLNKYSKEIQIKGFRKGKVPASIIEKKFGEGIMQETSGKIIDEAFKEALDSLEKGEMPLGYEAPSLEGEPELKAGEDFTFAVTYDVFPTIELEKWDGIELEEPQVKVLKKHENAELEKLREQNAIVQDKASKTIAKDNIITINYAELDEAGEVIEGTSREDFVFTQGTGQNYYKIDDDIKGMKVNGEKTIEKTYADDFEVSELAGTTKKIKVKIVAVKERILPALDDELAQDVSEDYETLEDLRKATKKQLEDRVNNLSKAKMTEQLMEKLRGLTEFDIPQSMVKQELENNWRNFLQQFGMPEDQIMPILEAQGRTKEDMMNDWKEESEKNLRSQLVLGYILEKETVEVSDADVDEELSKQAEMYGMQLVDIKNTFTQNGMIDYLKNEISRTKLVDLLIEKAKVIKGEKIDFDDFVN
ncbi:MAG: trigger factor [Spirochaetales bacterium]|nr:trigger factor [Spirochaetales bacterium]